MTRDDIVAATREWIGTPYRHQHSTKGAGTDCLGLVRGVYRDVIGDEPEKPPVYSPSWGEVGRTEPLLEAARRHLTPKLLMPEPGDVVIFRMRKGMIAKHCGIITSSVSFVHAYQGVDRVTETSLVGYWTDRIVAVFEFPGVS